MRISLDQRRILGPDYILAFVRSTITIVTAMERNKRDAKIILREWKHQIMKGFTYSKKCYMLYHCELLRSGATRENMDNSNMQMSECRLMV